MGLDHEGKYLIQEKTGHIYPYTEALAKRKDMKQYDPGGTKHDAPIAGKTVPIELQGKTFNVDAELYDVLMDMGNVMVGLQEENRSLKAAAATDQTAETAVDEPKTGKKARGKAE